MKIRGTTTTTPIARHAVTDDTAVSKKPWSSKNTVDKLCPSFTESGSVVTCEPVEGYPLEVVSKIEVVQEGSGDPSFENIRPIVGRNEIKLRICGKNLLSEEWKSFENYKNNQNMAVYLPKGEYVLSAEKTPNLSAYLYLQKSEDGGVTFSTKSYLHTSSSQPVASVKFTVTDADNEVWSLWTQGQAYLDRLKWVQIERGTVATDYEPFNGNTFTFDLGQTVYGGSYNWATGELTLTWKKVALTGEEQWNYYNSSSTVTTGYFMTIQDKALGYATSLCTHFKNTNNFAAFDNNQMAEGLYADHPTLQNVYFDWGGPNTSATGNQGIKNFKAWLKAQYDAGTPVELCYQLAEPITIQSTPNEVLALQGVNTLYSNTGDITVTGRADPVAIIEKLTNAIIALGGNV